MSGDDLYLGESGAPEVDPRMMSPVGRTDSGHKPAGYVPGARSNLQAREQLRNLSNVIAAPMGCSRRLTHKQPDLLAHELENLTFTASTRLTNCKGSTLADSIETRKVVDQILSLYNVYPKKRRVLLALASVGIEYSCVYLYHLCCRQDILYDSERVNFLEVTELPDSIRVIDIYNDLLDVSSFLGSKVCNAEKQSRSVDSASRKRLYYNEALKYVNWREMGWGLFTFLSSLEGRNNMKSKIVCRETVPISHKPLVVHSIGNCIVTSLIACVAAEIEDDLNLDLTSQCARKQGLSEADMVKRSIEHNFDDFAHVVATSLEYAEHGQIQEGLGRGGLVSGGTAHDVFYFVLAPLEFRMYNISSPDNNKNTRRYLTNLRDLHENLKNQMQKMCLEISRGPLRIPPSSRADRLSEAQQELDENEGGRRHSIFNSGQRKAFKRNISNLSQSIRDIGPHQTRLALHLSLAELRLGN